MHFFKIQTWLAIIGLITYLSLALDRSPRVSTNEPWESITSYQLYFNGQFNNPVLTGLEFLDEHFLSPKVIHPLILGAFYKMFGLSLLTGRTVTLLIGFGTLFFFYRLLKWEFPQTFFVILGVILLATDNFFYYYARTIREEVFTTFFGMGSFFFVFHGISSKRPRLFLVAGLFNGIGVCTHPAFVIFSVSLLVVLLFEYRERFVREKCFWIFIGGSLIATMPYLVYLISEDWQNGFFHFWTQIKGHAPQGDAGFWYQTFIKEGERYAKYVVFPYRITIVLMQLVFIIYSFRISDRLTRFSQIVVITHIMLLPILINTRNPRYMLPMIPFVVILILKSLEHMQLDSIRSYFKFDSSYAVGKKAIAIGAMLLIFVQFIGNPINLWVNYSVPYNELLNDLRGDMPVHSRVLGPMTFWFGFSEYQYRTEETYEYTNADSAIHAFAPDYLITHEMYWWKNDKAKWSRMAGIIEAFAEEKYEPIREIHDRTYGPITIWKLKTKPTLQN